MDTYCIAFTGGGVLRNPGFEQGFHEYYWTDRSGKVEDVFPQAVEWLTIEPVQPFFVFLHTYESHIPYTRETFCMGLPHGRLGNLARGESLLPAGMTRSSELSSQESLYVQAAYDGGVKMASDATAEFFSVMEDLGLWRNTVVVVTSDHGEEFWEHSEYFATHHEFSLYGELLNVPLMICAPESHGQTLKFVDVEVSTVDLLPTVLDLLDINSRVGFDGLSVRPAMDNRTLIRKEPILATNWPPGRRKGRDGRVCVISQRRKYIARMGEEDLDSEGAYSRAPYHQEIELFLLDEDHAESRNTAEESLLLVQQMTALLEAGLETAIQPDGSRDGTARDVAVAPDLKRQLRALGYLDTE